MSRVSKETLLNRSNRNMANGTHPVVRESALELVSRAYDEGINVQISEGHRSYARQNQLYAQGRTRPGNIVTNARGGQSWHNFGIAVDFFLTNHDGSKAVWTVNRNWRRVAEIAKSLGFEWGGDWTSFKDYPHLQMRGGLTMSQMRAGRKPNLVSRVNNPIKPSSKPGSSKPATSPTKWTKKTGNWTGQVLKKGDHGTPVLQAQQMLAHSYFYPEKGAKRDGVDGYYGDKTVDAVRRYQDVHGLKVDGVLGKETYDSLKGNTSTIKPEKPVTPQTNKWSGQVLKPGDRGANVSELQRLLVGNNFYPDIRDKNNGVDGIYGNNTTDAVRRFQMMNGLSVDGIAGPTTYIKLTGGKSTPTSKPKSTGGSWKGQVLKVGDSGPEVRDLQEKLSAKYFYPDKGAKNNGIDGHYGKKTEDAVMRFQSMNGLKADGIAGPATYRKLA